MPNWCSTKITIHCKSEQDALRFADTIESSLKSVKMKNGFGDTWLGNILLNLDLATVQRGEYEETIKTDYRCRGTVLDLFQSSNEVTIYTDTAWSPMLKMWTAVADKILGEGNYEKYYTAEEPGCELYGTNDPNMVGRVFIDFFDNYEVLEKAFEDCDQSEEEFIEDAQRFMKTDEKDFYKLVKMLESGEYGESISVHKYEYYSWEDCI